jgi:hypothetical protein
MHNFQKLVYQKYIKRFIVDSVSFRQNGVFCQNGVFFKKNISSAVLLTRSVFSNPPSRRFNPVLTKFDRFIAVQ